MLEGMPMALVVGTVLGFLSGIGVGGGSLLILWLTLVLGMEYPAARILNLLFFLPAAGIACFFRWRQGQLRMRVILPAIVSGCIGAAVFSQIGTVLDTALLKKLFGALLIATGLRELLYKPKT